MPNFKKVTLCAEQIKNHAATTKYSDWDKCTSLACYWKPCPFFPRKVQSQFLELMLLLLCISELQNKLLLAPRDILMLKAKECSRNGDTSF